GATGVVAYAQGKRAIDALLPPDMKKWRLHDLRRSFASGLARLGVNLPVIEKCLNHQSGSFAGIVGVYQHYDLAAERMRAFDRWGEHIDLVVSGTPAVVIPLRAGA